MMRKRDAAVCVVAEFTSSPELESTQSELAPERKLYTASLSFPAPETGTAVSISHVDAAPLRDETGILALGLAVTNRPVTKFWKEPPPGIKESWKSEASDARAADGTSAGLGIELNASANGSARWIRSRRDKVDLV